MMSKKTVNAVFKKLYSEIGELVASASKQLPDEFQSNIKPLATEIETVLASIKTDADNTDGDEGEQHSFDPNVLKGVFEIVTKQQAKIADQATQLASLDNRISEAVKAKVTSGEYLTKEDAEQKATEAVNAERQRNQLISNRRTEVVTASLPVPLDEKVFELSDEDYKKAVDAAKTRLETLKGKKVTLQAAMLSKLAWCKDEDFSERVELIDAAAKTASPKADPFVAGAGEGSKLNLGNIWV